MQKLKLKLDLDALKVTSFDTDDARPDARGTVHGRMPHKPVEETDYTCPTMAQSCQPSACPDIYNTCGYSCDCVTSTANNVFCH